jgi:ribosomal-protein-serine acetyltransferase
MRLPIKEGLYLQTIQEKHADELFRLIDTNRIYLRKWMPWEKNQISREDALLFITESEKELKEKRSIQAGLFYKETLCGMVGLHQINWLNKNARMGYWLSESFQGRGLTTQAAQRLLDYCFQELLLHRIEIYCGLGNGKSQAVAERLGFTLEGVLKETEWLNGKFIDHALYGLINKMY